MRRLFFGTCGNKYTNSGDIYIYILFWLLQWDCNNANGATRMKRTDEQSFPFVWPDPALVLKTVVQAAVEQAKVDHLQI